MSDLRIESYSTYRLPASVRVQSITLIRQLMRSGTPDGPSADAPDPGAASDRLAMLYQALNIVPEIYRDGILQNIVDRRPFEAFASEATWYRWKQRFLYTFAMTFGLY